MIHEKGISDRRIVTEYAQGIGFNDKEALVRADISSTA